MTRAQMERDAPPRPKKPARKTGRPYERPRGGPARAVSDLVPQIGRTAFRRFGFVQSSGSPARNRWPHHAKVCAPESIRFPPGEKSEGILQLVVTPTHAPIIQHVFPEIIEQAIFGHKAVARIKMRQGAPLAIGPTG